MIRSLLVVLANGAAFQSKVVVEDTVTAFVHVSVIPMDRERILTDQTVLVRGSRIIGVGPADQTMIPSNAKHVDGHGKFLLPGFGDMHVHLDDPLLLDDLERGMLMELADGVTLIRDMRSRPEFLTLRRQVASGKIPGPTIFTGRIYSGGRLLDSAVQSVIAAKKAGYDFLKIYDIEADTTLFDTIVATAKRVGLPFAGHAQRVGLKHVLQSGYRSIEHWTDYPEYIVAASSHGRMTEDSSARLIYSGQFYRDPKVPIIVDDAEVVAIAKATQRAGVWNVPTQNAFERITQWRFDTLTRQLVKALVNAKAGILLGTDLSPLDVSVSRELASLVHVGLTPYQALETTTKNVAAFYDALDTLGTVTVGKRADLVLLDDNPLVDIHATALPSGTMANGRWYPRIDLMRLLLTPKKSP